MRHHASHDYRGVGVFLTNTDNSTQLPSRSSETWQSPIFHLEEQIYSDYLPQLTQSEAETCFKSEVFFLSMNLKVPSIFTFYFSILPQFKFLVAHFVHVRTR